MSWVPALCVVLVSGYFTVLVFRQWTRNSRRSHLFWSLSLMLSTLGSLFYCISLWTEPHSGWSFLLYYLFGAMWMPSIMGLGSLCLVLKNRSVTIFATVVVIVGLIGTGFLLAAPLSSKALSAFQGGAGSGIVQMQPVLLAIFISLNSFGALAVVIVALVSAWKAWRKQAPSRFFLGNLWLAVGIILMSGAGSSVRLGFQGMFWITMFVGWLITFAGYRLLTPRPVERVAEVGSPSVAH